MASREKTRAVWSKRVAAFARSGQSNGRARTQDRHEPGRVNRDSHDYFLRRPFWQRPSPPEALSCTAAYSPTRHKKLTSA